MSRLRLAFHLLVLSLLTLTACTQKRSNLQIPRSTAAAAVKAQVPTVPADTDGAPAAQADADEEDTQTIVKPRAKNTPLPLPESPDAPDAPMSMGDVPPPVTTAPVDNQPPQLAEPCGSAWGRNDKNWFPGLPYMPAQAPKVTGGGREQFQYTDASRDGLLNLAIDQVHALGAETQDENRVFANRLDDVSAFTDINSSGAVEVRFNFEYKPGQFAAIAMRGQMRAKSAGGRVNTQLRQTEGQNAGRFAGRITCADLNGGCENTMITIQRLTKRGMIGTEAHVVHRFGSAHVQVAEQDQLSVRTIQNRNHAILAQYFANTVNNSCMAALYEVKRAGRKMDQCRVKRLEQQCGGQRNQLLLPAAKAFAIRTFAIAYGRAGFEFAAIDKDNDPNSQNSRLVIKGPLVVSGERPVWPNKLHVEEAVGIHTAHLIANDGGGNLNLQLVFKGKPNSHTRFSISTLFEPTRPELQGPVQTAK
ncbi:MAG: hypothetical protein KF799_00850 [Bdellovibrionales bacterium]|nr:hypothetical protein [Bdellovibrionales bacterium]